MKSLWQDYALPAFPQLQETIETDVLVIGGGMAGLLTAHCLTRAGVRCVVAEADRVASGVTGGTTAKLTVQHGLCYHRLLERLGMGTAGAYLEANQKALECLRELCMDTDCDYREADHAVYTLRDRAALEAELTALQSLGCPAALEEAVPVPFATAGAVRFLRQGQFHPRKLMGALLPQLTVYEHTRVRKISKGTAYTDYGAVKAEKFVVATHFPFINRHGGYFLKLHQQRAYVIALENAPVPEGMYLGEGEGGLSFRGYGDVLLLGGESSRTGEETGGWRALEQKAREYYPDARILRRWAAQDCMSLDEMPYIGQYSPRTPELYVATGFNKWGMTGSMLAAQLLTDQILEKDNPYTSVFSPARSMLHPQLGENLWESTRNLLTVSTPRCPHLGCALKWNPFEHSWDCPCHGSRFAESGKLLDNPATDDLR